MTLAHDNQPDKQYQPVTDVGAHAVPSDAPAVPPGAPANDPDHAGDHEPVPQGPSARDLAGDELVPEPEATTVFAYEIAALAERQTCILTHLHEMAAALAAVLARQHIVMKHCQAILAHIEKETLP
jgi:hypothetical protein